MIRSNDALGVPNLGSDSVRSLPRKNSLAWHPAPWRVPALLMELEPSSLIAREMKMGSAAILYNCGRSRTEADGYFGANSPAANVVRTRVIFQLA